MAQLRTYFKPAALTVAVALGLMAAPDAESAERVKARAPRQKTTTRAPIAKRIAAEGACLREAVIDNSTGKTLYGRHEHDPILPASTSKLMLNVVIGEAVRTGILDPNEKMTFVLRTRHYDICALSDVPENKRVVTETVSQALRRANISSSNVAALALQAKVEQKTGTPYTNLAAAKAAEIGMTDSIFVEAAGVSGISSCLDIDRNVSPWRVAMALAGRVVETIGGKVISYANAESLNTSLSAKPHNITSAHDLALLIRYNVNNAFTRPFLEEKYLNPENKRNPGPKTNSLLRMAADILLEDGTIAPSLLGKSGTTSPAGNVLAWTNTQYNTSAAVAACLPTAYDARNARAQQLNGLSAEWYHAKTFAPVAALSIAPALENKTLSADLPPIDMPALPAILVLN